MASQPWFRAAAIGVDQGAGDDRELHIDEKELEITFGVHQQGQRHGEIGMDHVSGRDRDRDALLCHPFLPALGSALIKGRLGSRRP